MDSNNMLNWSQLPCKYANHKEIITWIKFAEARNLIASDSARQTTPDVCRLLRKAGPLGRCLSSPHIPSTTEPPTVRASLVQRLHRGHLAVLDLSFMGLIPMRALIIHDMWEDAILLWLKLNYDNLRLVWRVKHLTNDWVQLFFRHGSISAAS